jgi:hypothetical protein
MPSHRSALASVMLAAVLLGACAASRQTSPVDQRALYDQAVYQAAVKRPDDRHVLLPIDTPGPTVSVIHLQSQPNLDQTRFIWVAQPEELRAACRGKPDPVLALQQTLGLPPEPRPDWRLARFDVAKTRLFRPCISGQGITSNMCEFDPPRTPPSGAAGGTEYFVFTQAARSWRAGFPQPGYPFTGMGWSYNWSPDAPRHHGISEYVITPGKPAIGTVTWVTPAEFCAP